jgi:HK97 family phage portal protein
VSWFDRYVWRRQPKPEQRTISGVPWNVGDDVLPGAKRVTFDRAASFAAVFSAWRYLGDQVATLPLHAYRDLGDRRQRMASLPSLFAAPAAQGTLVDWLFRAVVSMASRGNAVGLVMDRDGFGFPIGVEWTNPDDWWVDDQPPQGSLARPRWYYLGREIPTEQVVHIPWFPVPGRIWGLSPMGAYAATVAAALGAQEYAAGWFAGGGAPPGTYKNETQVIDKDTAEQVKARLVAAIRTRQPIVYGKDWTYTPITINPEEAQFIESQQLGATQIASIYGVPPRKVGGTSAAGNITYANVDAEQIAEQTDAVLPWVAKFEAKFFTLLPERQYIRFALDAHVRTDIKTRYETYEIARRIGLRSVDELRQLEDLEPLPDGQGATYTPQPLLEKGIGSVPKPGEKPEPAKPAGELGRPRLVPPAEDDAEDEPA